MKEIAMSTKKDKGANDMRQNTTQRIKIEQHEPK